MKISHDDHNELTVLTLRGDLTGDAADRLRRAAIERLDCRVRDFVLDLAGLGAVDSAGLEALLWLQEQCEERLGQVRLTSCPGGFADVLRMTRLDQRLTTCPDLNSAILSLGSLA